MALRVQNDPNQSGLFFLMGDHDRKEHDSGSTSVSYNASTQDYVIESYKSWGELRDGTNSLPTNYTYAGQYNYTANFDLMYYGARWYDSSLGRFTQPDTITPDGTQGLDRYHYASNNPLRYIDPTGHDDKPTPSNDQCVQSNYYAPGCGRDEKPTGSDDPAWDEVWDKYSKYGLEALTEEELKMYYNYQGAVTVIGPGDMKDEAGVIAFLTVWAPPISAFFSALALADSVAEDVNNGQLSEDTVFSIAGQLSSSTVKASGAGKAAEAVVQGTEILLSYSNKASPPTRYNQFLPLTISPPPYTQYLPVGNYP